MSILSRIGSSKVPFYLDVHIHYLTAQLKNANSVKVVVKRGKDKKEETQPMPYSSGNVIFEYPLSFQTTIYQKNNTFPKKLLSFRLVQVTGTKSQKNGKVKVDYSQVAKTGKGIVRQEFNLKKCSDKQAVVCVSINLFPCNTPEFSSGNLRRSNTVNNQVSKSFVQTDDFEESPLGYFKQSPQKVKPSLRATLHVPKAEYFTQSTDSTDPAKLSIEHSSKPVKFPTESPVKPPEPSEEPLESPNESSTPPEAQLPDEPLTDQVVSNEDSKLSESEQILEELYTQDSPKTPPNQASQESSPEESPKNSLNLDFSADIVKPQKRQDSESSSEEEPIELDKSELIAPPTNFSATTPNSQTKEEYIQIKEKQAGISTNKRNPVCSKCQIF